MRTSVLLSAAAALSFALTATAQSTRLDVQVSNDNATWSDSMFAPAGSTFYVRVVASTTAPAAVGLSSITYQPTLSGWTAADSRLPFANSTGSAVPDASTPGVSLGRLSPFGSTSMASGSTPGLLSSFVDGGTSLRFAGSRATTMTSNLAYGVVSSQVSNSVAAGFGYNASNSPVIFKYAVQLSTNPTMRTMIADVPLAGIQSARASWYTSLVTGSGAPLNYAITAADIHPATIHVGPPNATPVANNDAFSMLENQSLFVTNQSVLDNDTDADAGDTKTAELVTGAGHGALTLNPDGTFSYIPQQYFNGADSFTYRVRDRYNAGSNTATVTINVANINQPPVITAADPTAVLEDSGERTIPNWASINPGPGESWQQITSVEVMSVSHPEMFSVLPTVSADGTLRYTPAPNTAGASTFEIRVHDNGGVANGGTDVSVPGSFTIDVMEVNDAPTFAASPVPPVSEDAGQQSIANWASFNPGPNEGNQSLLGYAVTNITNPSLFSVPPTIAPDGTLVYTPAPNATGSSSFTVTARDNGGTANGGSDTSAPQTFTINVVSVNDAPTFTAANPATVNEDAGSQTIANWAVFSPGGGSAESAQAVLQYVVSNISNPGMFSVAPAVSNTGTLTYTLAPDASGTATFQVQVRDNGGTANGGVDTSSPQTFTITANPVNDAPTFAASNPTSNEDAGPVTLAGWATFNPGGGTWEAGQAVLGYTVSNLTNAALFSVPPSVANDGTLTYTTAVNVSGTATFQLRVRDSGGVANGGVDTSAIQTFTITVNPVNDAPIVSVAAAPAVNEDSGSQTVTAYASFNPGGSGTEISQGVSAYIITNISNPALFSAGPSISNTGALTYTPAPNAFGTATFNVQVRDNGGTANGGVDTSVAVLGSITINPVNDAPTFAAGALAPVNEDGGPVTISTWATFDPGPGEVGQQVLAYSVSSISNPSLFSVAPAVANDGTLTYTTASNANGTSTFQVRVRDNGGTGNGGSDLSAAQTFTLTVNAVNDAPVVTLGSIPATIEDGGAQTVNGFASFNPGAANESGQSVLQYIVSNVSNPAMFVSGPTVSNTGVLTYTPAPNASGSATFQVQVRDNGGTANGGVDTSSPVTATINITDINDPPSFAAANASSNEDVGPVNIAGWASFNPGPFETGQGVLAYSVANISNPGLFSVAPTVSNDGTLHYTSAPYTSGSSTFQVRVRDTGGTASGGVDTSTWQTFSISVIPVNHSPTVTLATLPAIEEDSGMQIIGNFATFSPGSPNEMGQQPMEYIISDISNPDAFAVPPAISPAGVLFYMPMHDASGTLTFRVQVRDNGGTTNGGSDLSAPVVGTIVINGVNDPPVVRVHDVTIDARSGCVGLGVLPGQLDAGSYDVDNARSELTMTTDHTGEFPVGSTLVRLTVRDPGGLSATATATVTVLGNDTNHNGVPDSCDLIRGGGGPDCNGNGSNEESQCLWDNGSGSPTMGRTNGQLSQYGGNPSARVADDFYLTPGFVYHLTSFRAQIVTNSLERGARLSLFRDCDGVPYGEPFYTVETTDVSSESPTVDAGDVLVTYVFNLCEEHLVLDGGQTYWVSIQGKVSCNDTDRAFWASVGATPTPRLMIGSVPYKAFGTGPYPCIPTGYEDWNSIADCCIGCVNMSYLITGEPCQLLLDNGKLDLNPTTRGGDPSGINRGVFARAADNIGIKPCQDETLCFIEAYIWTNCDPVQGFLELYDNACNLPTGQPLHRIAPTQVIALDESARIEGVLYRGYRLTFWDIPWVLRSNKNYWISVGADGTGSFNARSFLAYADQADPCSPCQRIHITNGATMPNRQSDPRWVRSMHEYALRVATKPVGLDIITTGPAVNLCPPDFNRDGLVGIQDIFDYMNAFFLGCP